MEHEVHSDSKGTAPGPQGTARRTSDRSIFSSVVRTTRLNLDAKTLAVKGGQNCRPEGGKRDLHANDLALRRHP